MTFIDQWPAQVEEIRSNGVRIVMPHQTLHEQIAIFQICDVATFTRHFDYAFIVLKADDARWGAEPINPHLNPTRLMVVIQNRMTAEEVTDIAGPGRSLGCVLEIPSGLHDPGTIIRDSPPDRSWFAVGSLDDGSAGREQEVAMTVKTSISLTDEQYAFARSQVESGRYSSVSAVLQQGLDVLCRRLGAEELETASLRKLLSDRRQGEFTGVRSMDERLAGMIADKRRAHGLQS